MNIWVRTYRLSTEEEGVGYTRYDSVIREMQLKHKVTINKIYKRHDKCLLHTNYDGSIVLFYLNSKLHEKRIGSLFRLSGLYLKLLVQKTNRAMVRQRTDCSQCWKWCRRARVSNFYACIPFILLVSSCILTSSVYVQFLYIYVFVCKTKFEPGVYLSNDSSMECVDNKIARKISTFICSVFSIN